MQMIELLNTIGAVLMGIIGFFLRQTMQELRDMKEIAYKTKTKVEVLENDYLNKVDTLNRKFDSLHNAIDRLTIRIEELNTKIVK